MKNRIASAVLFSALITIASLADDAEFVEHKNRALKRLEDRMAKLAEHKACIEKSAERKALRACHEAMEAWHDTQRKERREHQEKAGN